MLRFIIIGLVVLLTAPHVYAALVVSEIGSLGSDPTAIAAIDSDSNGVPDTAVVGTSSKAMARGASLWTISVANVFGVAPADFDKNGYMNGVVIAGKDIVAVGPTGTELWRAKGYLGKSAVAADLDGDGYKDEVVVGCWDKVAAFDSDGESLWNYTGIAEKNVRNIVLTEKSIIGSAGKMLYFFRFNGNLRAGKAQNDSIVAISPIDLEGTGTMNGVVVITKEEDTYVKINAYTMYGENKGWSASLYHEADIVVGASPIDKYSTGKKENVVFNLYSGAYWVNSQGVTTKIGDVYSPGAVAPIDFDGDKIFDDIIVGTKGSEKAGKLYAYSAYGQELRYYNKTGGIKIVAVDMTFDGKANDAIVATSFDKRIYSIISDISDTTTATTPVTTTPAPTTTAPPTTTPAPTATAAPTTTPATNTTAPPTTTPAAGTDNASAADTDLDGWKDALELQMGTDPNNPDTDGDGILDSKDPNPLVASSGGSILGGFTGTLITIVKWLVIGGGAIVAIIFIREKILDMRWEKNQDWGE